MGNYIPVTKNSIGLGNVDNTSDATKNAAAATLANKTLTTPTIASFTNATHNHTNSAGGGQLTASTSLNATGTPSSSTYLRGDNTWATISGGSGDVVGPSSSYSRGVAVFNDGTGKLLASSDVSIDSSGNMIVLADATVAGHLVSDTPGTSSNSVVTNAGSQTLTNKRITKRVSTTTSSATPTINTDNVDMYGLTAQAADITSFTTNLSGTPTDGQQLWIYIVGTAARAITWGSSFEASTVALPTTTVLTNRLDVGFVWNAATSKWRCIATG